ncbi:MAG: YbaB/EbfC family nucleoid-associated protein [Chloroflexi bacterium]|nr:YbaB/EbfC family nucleoid-associated protein [Chloroflexota bacterium]
MLEETIIAAVNEVMREAQELAAKKLGRLTGGMGLPGL